MQYLIDANILLWHATNDERLPVAIRKKLTSLDSSFWISIASLWEITIKSSRGNLDLAGDLDVFIERRVLSADFRIIPIRPEHLLTLRSLPFHHKDPFDRLVVAQSLAEKLPLLYTDKVFEVYFTQS